MFNLFIFLISITLPALSSAESCLNLFEDTLTSSELLVEKIQLKLSDSKLHLRNVGPENQNTEQVETYLKRSKFSAVNIFGNFFETLDSQSFETYLKMLKKHHVHLVQGDHGSTSPYTGYVEIQGTSEPSGAEYLRWHPSQMLFEIDQFDRRKPRFAVSGPKETLGHLKYRFELSGVNREKVEIKDPTITKESNVIETRGLNKVFRVNIDLFGPYPMGDSTTLRLSYIPYIHHQDALRVMFELLKSIDELKPQEALEKIALYYQLGINCHLFERVNNSLLMGHVNYLLLKKGFSGISHLYLDYIANFTNSEEFKKIFTQIVLQNSFPNNP